ncbi:MAG: hypothetical protein WCP21_11915 [Armatimonadota bacterium]
MERCYLLVSLVLLAGLLTCALTGCGGGIVAPGHDNLEPTATQSVMLMPFTDSASQTPRWMDIADYLYAPTFAKSFLYPANSVKLTFSGSTGLQFTISAPAHALKPNFCYQMKLEGPSQAWSGDLTGADFTNWTLGHNGRWWNDTDNIPLTDAQIADHVGDKIKGYLYFDFIFTNKYGSVSQTSLVKNSYHVTWKTLQRTRTINDGPARLCSVQANKDGWAYNAKQPAKTINLYGEWEPGRAAPGTLTLPAGVYSGIEFRLTEESFHSTSTSGGAWRTVMTAPLAPITVQ